MDPIAGPATLDDATPRQRQDWAYRQIRNLIVTGEISPGSPIIESRMAERLQLTRTPVRAALLRLEQEGYVTSSVVEKYSRMTVAPLTVEALNELFLIHGALEGVAARLATMLPGDQREQLALDLEETNAALHNTSFGTLADKLAAQDLHVRFHQIVVEAAAGPRLYAQIEAIQPQVERYERFYTHVLLSGIDDSVREHEDIIAAIREGDAAAAEAATELNWRKGAERYESAVALSRRGTW